MTKPILTDHQKQILCLITHPNKQIAAILGISRKTVNNDLTNIYQSLHLDHISRAPGSRRIAAITTALQHDIITLDEISPGDRPASTAFMETETVAL